MSKGIKIHKRKNPANGRLFVFGLCNGRSLGYIRSLMEAVAEDYPTLPESEVLVEYFHNTLNNKIVTLAFRPPNCVAILPSYTDMSPDDLKLRS